jgi:CBS domain-containing protein
MRVCDLMDRDLLVCDPEEDVQSVARMMRDNQYRPVIVVHASGEVWGLVSRLALIRFYEEDLHRVTAEDIMRPYQIDVDPQWPIEKAIDLMRKRRMEHLIIIDPHAGPRRPIGLLSSFHIVQYMSGVVRGQYQQLLRMPGNWSSPSP